MKSRVLLLFLLSRLSVVLCQNTQSPCPETFEYRNDGGQIYGLIEIQPFGEVSTVTIKVNFTIAAPLPSSYVGKVEPIRTLSEIHRSKGSPIQYKVHFPITSPLPRLTSLSVNDNILCYGPGDLAGPGSYVTTISLSHSLFFKGSGGGQMGNTIFINQIPNQQNDKRPTVNYVVDDGQVFTIPSDDRYGDWNDFPTSVNNDKPEPSEPVYQPEFRPTQRPRPTNRPRPTPQPLPQTPRPPPSTSSTEVQCGVQANSEVPLIYNGETYERGEWPWLVAIYKRTDKSLTYTCSGTLVSNMHVISAAHCMHQRNSYTSINDVVVKVGAYNLEDWGDEYALTRTVASASIHENYNPKTLANDILVMTFHRTVEYNNFVRPLCLWNGNIDLERVVGASGVVAGWGRSEFGPGGQGLPRSVKIPIVSTSTCRASNADFHKLTSGFTLCAGDRNGAGPCLGDSGGGLYIYENRHWQLRGVVSLSLRPSNGDSTCNLNEYIVFTDTAQYLPWIHNKMGN